MSFYDAPWPFTCFGSICPGEAGHKVSAAEFTFVVKSVYLVAGDRHLVLMCVSLLSTCLKLNLFVSALILCAT